MSAHDSGCLAGGWCNCMNWWPPLVAAPPSEELGECCHGSLKGDCPSCAACAACRGECGVCPYVGGGDA